MTDPGFPTPASRFEQEVVDPIKLSIETALAGATSEEDAKARVIAALPKGRSFLGPLVSFHKHEEADGTISISASAMVQTLDDQQNAVDIEGHFYS